ncbi:MAG: hypothetical protein OEZ06_00405 [Myxococcales bacterium]|nr:hypothetical protein [Myxococcales bacterium]
MSATQDITAVDPELLKLRRVKRAVKGLAVFVAASLVVALVFAAYSLITERPAKEIFLGPGPDAETVPPPEFELAPRR